MKEDLFASIDSQKILNLTHLNYTKGSQCSTSHLPCFGDRWGEFVQRMRERINLRFENVHEVILFAQTKVNFTHRFGASSVAYQIMNKFDVALYIPVGNNQNY